MNYITETDNIINELINNRKKIPIERYNIMDCMMDSMNPQQESILTEDINNMIINFNKNKNDYINTEINKNNKRDRVYLDSATKNKK